MEIIDEGDGSYISIHAPHARSDFSACPLRPPGAYFNPRSSCEERRARQDACRDAGQFQSTLLMRGATWELAEIDYVAGIFQSTLLMRGATL